MSSHNALEYMLRNYLIQSPIMLVAMIGIIATLLSWHKSTSASIWCLSAFGLAFLICVLLPISQEFFIRALESTSVNDRSFFSTTISFVWSFLRAVTYALLLVAVYVGRKSNAPAATPAG